MPCRIHSSCTRVGHVARAHETATILEVMESRAARLLRGILLGSVATLLAAISHTWAGSVSPGPLALVLGTVFASAVGVAVLGRKRRVSLPRIAVGVAISQLAFHLMFALLGGGADVVMTSGHHPTVAAFVASPGEAIARGGAAMWLAHLAAGVLTIAYLRTLERLVWALLARAAGYLVRTLSIRIDPVATPARVVVTSTPDAPLAERLRVTIARRGPPVTVCA